MGQAGHERSRSTRDDDRARTHLAAQLLTRIDKSKHCLFDLSPYLYSIVLIIRRGGASEETVITVIPSRGEEVGPAARDRRVLNNNIPHIRRFMGRRGGGGRGKGGLVIDDEMEYSEH